MSEHYLYFPATGRIIYFPDEEQKGTWLHADFKSVTPSSVPYATLKKLLPHGHEISSKEAEYYVRTGKGPNIKKHENNISTT